MPAVPGVEQFSRVGVGRHDAGDVFDVQALLIGKAAAAVLTFPVGAFERCPQPGHLGTFRWIRRRGERQPQLQQHHLARHIGRQLQAVESGSGFGQPNAFSDGALIGLGRKNSVS